jgi:hypothetical protein
MPSAPYYLSISAGRAGSLFASPLQRSDEPCGARLLNLAWPDFPAGIIAE